MSSLSHTQMISKKVEEVWVFQVLSSRVTPARSGLTSRSSRRGGYSATDSPRGGAVKLAEIHLCKE